MKYKLSIVLLCTTGSVLCMNDELPDFAAEERAKYFLERNQERKLAGEAREQHKKDTNHTTASEKVPNSDDSKK